MNIYIVYLARLNEVNEIYDVYFGELYQFYKKHIVYLPGFDKMIGIYVVFLRPINEEPKTYGVSKRSFYQGIVINGTFRGLQGSRWPKSAAFRGSQC